MGKRLNRVRDGWFECKRLESRVEELETLSQKITPVLSDMPKAHSGKYIDDTWALLADYRNECEAAIRQYIKDCRDLDEELNCINNPLIRSIMKARFIDCKTMESIADLLYIDRSTVYRSVRKGKKIYHDAWESEGDI